MDSLCNAFQGRTPGGCDVIPGAAAEFKLVWEPEIILEEDLEEKPSSVGVFNPDIVTLEETLQSTESHVSQGVHKEACRSTEKTASATFLLDTEKQVHPKGKILDYITSLADRGVTMVQHGTQPQKKQFENTTEQMGENTVTTTFSGSSATILSSQVEQFKQIPSNTPPSTPTSETSSHATRKQRISRLKWIYNDIAQLNLKRFSPDKKVDRLPKPSHLMMEEQDLRKNILKSPKAISEKADALVTLTDSSNTKLKSHTSTFVCQVCDMILISKSALLYHMAVFHRMPYMKVQEQRRRMPVTQADSLK